MSLPRIAAATTKGVPRSLVTAGAKATLLMSPLDQVPTTPCRSGPLSFTRELEGWEEVEVAVEVGSEEGWLEEEVRLGMQMTPQKKSITLDRKVGMGNHPLMEEGGDHH